MASYTYEHLQLGDDRFLGCNCCRFSKGLDLPVPKQLSLDEVAQLAKGFSESIFEDWSKLKDILERFEGLIQKRWLKKSMKQSREILLNAWPAMPTTHRPDFVGCRKALKYSNRTQTTVSSSYLWAYINLEDLQERHHLLLFLNFRGHHLPYMFTEPDFSYAHLGYGWRTEREAETGAQRMELFGQTTPSTYGRVLALNHASSAERRNITHPRWCGLLVLEIQQHVYNFLLSSVQHVLHDIDSDQFPLAPKLPVPELPDTSSNEWLSLTAHAPEAPYISMQSVDRGLLVNMAGARRASAEDHLFLLTEDPQYFVTSLKEWKEHAEITAIKVPKRAYKVLSALFPHPGAGNHQRTEIVWDELLQAMNTIGFQPMKLYGSVWMFMPKANGECKVDAKRSIQFHEPKEVRRGSKIPAHMLRTFGRRMKHAFGWVDGCLFVNNVPTWASCRVCRSGDHKERL